MFRDLLMNYLFAKTQSELDLALKELQEQKINSEGICKEFKYLID